jgi:hypothetical protein
MTLTFCLGNLTIPTPEAPLAPKRQMPHGSRVNAVRGPTKSWLPPPEVETIRDESSSDAGVSLGLLLTALPPTRPPLLFSVTAEVASTWRPPPAARCGGHQSSAVTAGDGSMGASSEATREAGLGYRRSVRRETNANRSGSVETRGRGRARSGQ